MEEKQNSEEKKGKGGRRRREGPPLNTQLSVAENLGFLVERIKTQKGRLSILKGTGDLTGLLDEAVLTLKETQYGLKKIGENSLEKIETDPATVKSVVIRKKNEGDYGIGTGPFEVLAATKVGFRVKAKDGTIAFVQAKHVER